MTSFSNNFSVVKRFSSKGPGTETRWNGLQFFTSCDIRLLGIGLYGGADNSARVNISQRIPERKVVADTNVEFGKCKIVDGIFRIFFDSPITIIAGASYDIVAESGNSTIQGLGGQRSIEIDGVTFSFRISDKASLIEKEGPIPEIYFQVVSNVRILSTLEMLENELKNGFERLSAELRNPDSQKEVENVRIENARLIEAISQHENESSKQLDTAKLRIAELLSDNESKRKELDSLNQILENSKNGDQMITILAEENSQFKNQIDELREILSQSKIGALRGANRALKFEELKKIDLFLVNIQLQNGSLLYFDNTKTSRELFTEIDGTRVKADLKVLDGECDCQFKGTIGDHAYFLAVKGKNVRLFKAYISDHQLLFEQINEVRASDIVPFKNEPMYYIDELAEWNCYKFDENYEEVEGEKFILTGLRLIKNYHIHYHRGILYFFRENTTPKLEKLNEKVVIVEGPVLDGPLSFHTPPHSDFIFITNSDQNVIITLDTTNLNVSQQSYDPPMESDLHSIVGVHEGILTMVFEGKGGVGRWLYTTRI